MEESFWHRDSIQRFSFEIPDSTRMYNVRATFRNSASYPFYNLYFQFTLKDPSEQILVQELKDVNLFDPKTGEPFGSGLGDLFDHDFVLIENYRFPSVGTYSISLEQYMRRDTLPLILSVGTRVEYANEQ